MPEPFSPGDLAGERLSVPEYLADFEKLEWSIGGQASWKLERAQRFREPGLESWEAFVRGDWERSVRLMEEDRDYLREYMAKASDLGIGLYRVRVVEEPVSPYLQWELLFLKLRAECGEKVRVVTSDLVRDLETDGPLPELLTMGSSRLYHVLYDSDEVMAGAVKITNPKTVRHAVEVTRHFYEQGEDLTAFYSRVIAPLPPPSGDNIVGE